METIQGVRTKLIVVSYSHGAVRVPLAQSFNYTPRITERTINEFDNLEAAQVVTTFDGIDVTFDYLDSDSKLVEAMFADADPDADVIVEDPTNYKKVTIFANMKGLETGKIFASVLAKQCRTKGAPYTEPVKEEARITRDTSGTNVLKFKGAAILYTRIHLATGYSGYAQAIPPNAYTDVGTSGYSGAAVTFGETLLPYDGVSGYDVYVLKNGEDVTGVGAYSMNSTTFTVLEVLGANDVYEVFGLYEDA